MEKTFVIADIHGADGALKQVFERSGFDYENDRLICLGDVCDRRPGVEACVEQLLQVKHLVMIMGNHDYWAFHWMREVQEERHDPGIKVPGITWLRSEEGQSWKDQGGRETMESYSSWPAESHYRFFAKAKYYHVENNRLFVHGGIVPGIALEEQDPQTFIWDRSLVEAATEKEDQFTRLTAYDAVYVGHTPTLRLPLKDAGLHDTERAGTPQLCNPRPAMARSPNKKNEYSSAHSHDSGMLSTGSQGKFRSFIDDRKRRQGHRWHDFPARQCNVYLMDTGAGWSGGRLSMMDIDTCEVWQSDPLH